MTTLVLPRTLDELYSLVSMAIYQAQVAKAKGDVSAARSADLIESMLEEEIADLLPANEEEGAIARRGVVMGAAAAGQFPRAVEMANEYLRDPKTTGALRVKLLELRNAAQVELNALESRSDTFDPLARFSIAA